MRLAHIYDGVALTKLLCWLHAQPLSVTELAIADKLESLRAACPDYLGQSFAPIIAAGALVKEGQVVPPNSLAVGVPARIIPYVNEERAQQNRSTAQHYVEMGQRHKSACSPASL